MTSQALGVAGSEWCEDWTSTFTRLSIERKISFERVPFSRSGSTRETKLDSERQSETCSMALVVLGHVLACFRVSFGYSWIGRPESPVRKASVNVRERPGLSRVLLKCARMCHWSFWHQEGFLESHTRYLLMLW
ncbi:hypothetical protein CDL15_Pgr016495 [Punica granatum]|uniref:Uncharacterized protein n=1 Tax=Punica granatum TaxID=22663 RepID=A0A218WJF3_PUNGR|nr:hypothetical protein CDL15_Pgr016495 [Punica granatum]